MFQSEENMTMMDYESMAHRRWYTEQLASQSEENVTMMDYESMAQGQWYTDQLASCTDKMNREIYEGIETGKYGSGPVMTVGRQKFWYGRLYFFISILRYFSKFVNMDAPNYISFRTGRIFRK